MPQQGLKADDVDNHESCNAQEEACCEWAGFRGKEAHGINREQKEGEEKEAIGTQEDGHAIHGALDAYVTAYSQAGSDLAECAGDSGEFFWRVLDENTMKWPRVFSFAAGQQIISKVVVAIEGYLSRYNEAGEDQRQGGTAE